MAQMAADMKGREMWTLRNQIEEMTKEWNRTKKTISMEVEQKVEKRWSKSFEGLNNLNDSYKKEIGEFSQKRADSLMYRDKIKELEEENEATLALTSAQPPKIIDWFFKWTSWWFFRQLFSKVRPKFVNLWNSAISIFWKFEANPMNLSDRRIYVKIQMLRGIAQKFGELSNILANFPLDVIIISQFKFQKSKINFMKYAREKTIAEVW